MAKTTTTDTARGLVRWLLLALPVLGVVLATHAIGESRLLVSVALGFLLGNLNLWVMTRMLGVLLFDGSGRLASFCGLGLTLKLCAMVGAAYALIAADLAKPIPLVLGCALSPLTHAFRRAPNADSATSPLS